MLALAPFEGCKAARTALSALTDGWKGSTLSAQSGESLRGIPFCRMGREFQGTVVPSVSAVAHQNSLPDLFPADLIKTTERNFILGDQAQARTQGRMLAGKRFVDWLNSTALNLEKVEIWFSQSPLTPGKIRHEVQVLKAGKDFVLMEFENGECWWVSKNLILAVSLSK